VDVPKDVAAIFENISVPSHYFNGEEGKKAWDEWVGESRQKNRLALFNRIDEETVLQETPESEISFTVLTEDEFEANRSEEDKIRIEKEAKRAAREMHRAAAVAANAAANSIDVAVPLISQSTTIQPVVVPAAVSSGSQDVTDVLSEVRKMMEVMGTLSTDALVESVLSRIGKNKNESIINVQEETPAEKVELTREIIPTAPAETDISELFHVSEKAVYEESPIVADNAVPEYVEEEQDDEFVDIFALISSAASRLRDKTILEQMEENQELTRAIQLEDLVKLLTKT